MLYTAANNFEQQVFLSREKMGVTDIGLKSTGFVAGVVFGIGVM